MRRNPFPRLAKRLLARVALVPVALAAVALLAACASTVGPVNAQLQGHWSVDSAASDDASARIASAIREAQKRRKPHRSAAGPAGPAGDESASAPGGGEDEAANDFDVGARIGPDFQQLRERLLQTLASPRTLTLKIGSDDVQIEGDGLPGRDYQPGDTITRFEEYGTAQLKAAWKDQAFVLTERYTSGARLEERYALDAHGALVYTRSLRDPTLGRIEVRSVYRRTG